MAKLDKKTRDSLKDSDFGIPSKRMYPIHDKAHVEAAVKLFGHASNEDKPELAHNILRKAKEFGMDSSGWTQINEWAKKYKGKNTNENADNLIDDIEKYENENDDDPDNPDNVNEAAAGASLLTVKNQLMKLVGNAFKFIGGSLVPKFTMQSTEKPAVAFDVNANGQNVEVTPKYNGVADTLHKKKGIAFMRAAEVIADFADNVVSSFKSSTPATESFYITIGDDRLYDMEDFVAYFEGTEYLDASADKTLYFSESDYLENNPFSSLLEEHYWDDITNTIIDDNGRIFDAGIFGDIAVQNTLNTFFKENTDIDICLFKEDVACVCIDDIVLESEMDFDDFFCEYGIEIFTETARPYDEYLRRHQYDPKSNTLIVNDRRISAGRVGSKKERNRINHFLIRHKYDPETETIETGYPDPANPGQLMRVPFRIDHASDTNPENFRAGYTPSEIEKATGSRKRLSNRPEQNAASYRHTGAIEMQPSSMMSIPRNSESIMGHEGGHSYVREIENISSPIRKRASIISRDADQIKQQRYKLMRQAEDMLKSNAQYMDYEKRINELGRQINELVRTLPDEEMETNQQLIDLETGVKRLREEQQTIKDNIPGFNDLEDRIEELDDEIYKKQETAEKMRMSAIFDDDTGDEITTDLATNESLKKKNIPHYSDASDYIESLPKRTLNDHDEDPEELTVDAMSDEITRKYLAHPSRISPRVDSNKTLMNPNIQQNEMLYNTAVQKRSEKSDEERAGYDSALSDYRRAIDRQASSLQARNQFAQQTYERRLQQQEANNSARRQAVIQQIQQQLQNPSLNKQQRDRLNRKLQRLMAYENGYQSRISSTTTPPVQANGGQIQYNPSTIPQDAAAIVEPIQTQTKKQSSTKSSAKKSTKSDDEKKPTAKKQESPKSKEKKPEASKPKNESKKSEEKPKDESKK